MTLAEELADRLSRLREIDDPFTGPAAPAEVRAKSRAWPTSPAWEAIDLFAVTEGAERRIEEYRYRPAGGGQFQPIGIVFEGDHARIYAQHHWVEDRGPILPTVPDFDPTLGPSDVLTEYFAALKSAELDRTLRAWEPDGYLQHSNGDTFAGTERLREDFTKFYKTGGIALKYCNKTDDGTTNAMEVFMPSGRPALAVYQRGPDAVAAARLYL